MSFTTALKEVLKKSERKQKPENVHHPYKSSVYDVQNCSEKLTKNIELFFFMLIVNCWEGHLGKKIFCQKRMKTQRVNKSVRKLNWNFE